MPTPGLCLCNPSQSAFGFTLLQALSVLDVPTSVLVKCYLQHRVTNLEQLLLVTIPADPSVSVLELKNRVSATLSTMLQASLGEPVDVCLCDLSWCGTACSNTKLLDYFLPLQQPLVFRADLKYSASADERIRTVYVKTLTGMTITVVVPSAATVEAVKDQLFDLEGWHATCEVIKSRYGNNNWVRPSSQRTC